MLLGNQWLLLIVSWVVLNEYEKNLVKSWSLESNKPKQNPSRTNQNKDKKIADSDLLSLYTRDNEMCYISHAP